MRLASHCGLWYSCTLQIHSWWINNFCYDNINLKLKPLYKTLPNGIFFSRNARQPMNFLMYHLTFFKFPGDQNKDLYISVPFLKTISYSTFSFCSAQSVQRSDEPWVVSNWANWTNQKRKKWFGETSTVSQQVSVCSLVNNQTQC